MRKLLNFIGFLAIYLGSCVLCYAQEASDQFYVVEDFSKLMQSQTSPYNNPPGIAADVLNVRSNDEIGSISKRPPLVSYGSCYNAPVKSLHRYYKSDATKYLVETVDTSIYLGSETGAACTQLGQGFTLGKHWDWVTYKDLAIGTNGTDYPVKWDGKTQTTANTDGSRTAGNMVADLGAPFAEQNTGSDLDASSWYQYKIAYSDGTNYYYANARSNPILTGSTVRNITLTSLPPCPVDWSACTRYLYRTVGNASRTAVLADTAYYLAQTEASVYAVSTNDTATDAIILADRSPKWSTVSAGINLTPPNSKHLLIDKERLWMANNPLTTQGGSEAYFSYLLDPDKFNTTNDLFVVRPDDGDEITMLEMFLGTLTVGKNNTISKIYTSDTNTDNWYVSNPISYIGSAAPYAVESTPSGILYLSPYGVYSFDGSTSKLFSDPVTQDIRLISSSAIADATSTYYNNEYNLAYTDSSTGENINNRVLVYDFIRQSWTKDIKYVDSWSIFDSGTDFSTLYSGSSKSDGKVSANSSSENQFITRYKSELDGGTFNQTDSNGIESNPTLTISSGVTIDASIYSSVSINAFSPATAIIDRITTVGTWESAPLDLNVSKFNKLYWNASLGTSGAVSFYIRSAATSAGLSGASYSSALTNPSGSDISTLSANRWVQIKSSLTTSDINQTPSLDIVDNYMIKLTYSKVGSVDEDSVYALWKSGWFDMGEGVSQFPKIIKEVDVYYAGTSGTLNVKFENLKGDITANFNIDLAHGRDPVNGYFGTGEDKVFRYNMPVVPGNANFLVGDKFRLTFSEDSSSTWKIQRVAIRWSPQAYVPYR